MNCMINPLRPDETNELHAKSSEEIEPKQIDTGSVTGKIQHLLTDEILTDPVDRKIIEEALLFLQSPTESIEEIKRHTSDVGSVVAGYMIRGEEPPAEIDAIYGQLITMNCQFHIDLVKAEKAAAEPDDSTIQKCMLVALNLAREIAKEYGNASCLAEVERLQNE